MVPGGYENKAARMKTFIIATTMILAMTPAFADPASGVNPGTVVGNVYESLNLHGFGLAQQPAPCGTFAYDPCPPAKPHKHPRPH